MDGAKRVLNIIIFFTVISMGCYPVRAHDTRTWDIDFSKKYSGKNTNPVLSFVYFYKKHISGAIGSRCPMYPSCSGYSVDAFKKHGFLLGWAMTCDRLLRCGRDEVNISGPIWVDGRKRCYDPVSNNDFWWK